MGIPLMSNRHTHSPEFKARHAMETIRGRKTFQEFAAAHAIDPIQVSQWNNQFPESVSELFTRGRKTKEFALGLPRIAPRCRTAQGTATMTFQAGTGSGSWAWNQDWYMRTSLAREGVRGACCLIKRGIGLKTHSALKIPLDASRQKRSSGVPTAKSSRLKSALLASSGKAFM